MHAGNDVDRLIKHVESRRNELLRKAYDRDEMLKAILELVYDDIIIASRYIDCPYCRRHMELEAGEVKRVLEYIEHLGNGPHKHGILERFKTIIISLKIFIYVVLGGLRRAGII